MAIIKRKSPPDDVFTYRRIRRSIGYLGFGLPVVLVLFSLIPFFETAIQPSISHYYYTNLREIFTGTLCAVGLFLIRYKGNGNEKWWLNDYRLTNYAGVMAFGVALFPTNPIIEKQKIYSLISYSDPWLGRLHYGFAGILFLIFANLAINVFTIGQKKESGTKKSALNENNIYRVCGYSIIVFIILVPILAVTNIMANSTLIMEALSLLCFGIAWLIKGRALGDEGALGEMLYREKNTVSLPISHTLKT
jgi:hypothetical protein